MSNLLTATEVAERLSFSRDWVYEQVRSGRLPVVVFGAEDRPLSLRGPRGWRFREEDVESFILTQRAKLTPPPVPGRELTTPKAVPFPGLDGKPRLRKVSPRKY